MKLSTHPEIPAASLQPLQAAVDAVEAARTVFDSAREQLVKAEAQVPKEDQAPTSKKQREAWDKKREDRLGKVAVRRQVVSTALEQLGVSNATLRTAVESFRAVAATLYDAGDTAPARRAASNVLLTDDLCAEVDELINSETPKAELPFLEGLLLRQYFLANQRHYTVRFRVESASWTYVQNSRGDQKLNVRPGVPCLTFGEAEKRCVEMGQRFGQKFNGIAFEIQCYDLVNKRSCGTGVCNSRGNMPPAQD